MYVIFSGHHYTFGGVTTTNVPEIIYIYLYTNSFCNPATAALFYFWFILYIKNIYGKCTLWVRIQFRKRFFIFSDYENCDYDYRFVGQKTCITRSSPKLYKSSYIIFPLQQRSCFFHSTLKLDINLSNFFLSTCKSFRTR